MTEVKIYIETTIHGPAQKKGKYMYMLETVRRGQTETRFGTGEGWEGENGLVLRATAASLHRLTRPCKVTIITTCDHVRAMISGGWPRFTRTQRTCQENMSSACGRGRKENQQTLR